MLRFKPFRALRPRPDAAARVASVPYDVCDRAEAKALAEGNPNSFLHVVRPEIDLPDDVDVYDDRVYEQARANLDRLTDEGVLVRDEADCVYLYRQVMEGRAQTGIVGCCHVEDYERDLIKKHEKTRPKKEDDRTRHTLTLQANAGPVFLTYRDDASLAALVATVMEQSAPIYDFTAPDGVQHTVWRVEQFVPFVEAFKHVPAAYVADGHHRSASAWRAGTQRREANPDHHGNEEYNWFLSVLFPATGLHILPYHRVLRDLGSRSPEDFLAALAEQGTVVPRAEPDPPRSGSFCFYLNGAWHRLDLPPESIDRDDPIRSLDVALLEERVLEPLLGITDVRTDERIDFVGGIRGTGALEEMVDSGAWACAISLFPTSIEQLLRVADAGLVMPPKSTWFEPKLRSGLLVHTLD